MDKIFDYQRAQVSYLHFLQAGNYSPKTMERMSASLRYLGAYLQKIGKEDLRLVTERHLTTFCEGILQKPWVAGSKRNVILTLKAFFKYLMRGEWLLFDPMSEMEFCFQGGRKLPQVLNQKEILALLCAPATSDKLGLRDRAILELFYSTGLRCEELLELSVQDIDGAQGVVFVRDGKGSKDRVVPVGRKALDWVERYIAQARMKLAGKTKMGLQQRGKPLDSLFLSRWHRRLSSSLLRYRLRHYAHCAGITKRVYPHLLRHTMATHLLENGASVRVVQEILGHAGVETTQFYTQVSQSQLKLIYKKYHPRGRWLWKSKN